MVVNLQPAVSRDTMQCLKNMSVTVTGPTLSLDMEDILVRSEVLSAIIKIAFI